MSFSEALSYILTFVGTYKYLLVFIGVIFEGPIIMIAAGFLLKLGAFSIVPLFLALYVGDLVADICWYYIGRFFAEPIIKKHGHMFGVDADFLEGAKKLFVRYHERILLISKITLGLGLVPLALAVLMVAGASRIKLSTYILLTSLGELVFLPLMLATGYFFGNLYGYVDSRFREIFAVVVILLFAVLIFWLKKYIKRKIVESNLLKT